MYRKYSFLAIGYCQSNNSLLLRNNTWIHPSCEGLVNLVPGFLNLDLDDDEHFRFDTVVNVF